LLVANTLLWPMARFLNDKFVPAEHRVTANHIMTASSYPLLTFKTLLCAYQILPRAYSKDLAWVSVFRAAHVH